MRRRFVCFDFQMTIHSIDIFYTQPSFVRLGFHLFRARLIHFLPFIRFLSKRQRRGVQWLCKRML